MVSVIGLIENLQAPLWEKNIAPLKNLCLDIQSDAIRFLNSIPDDWAPQIA